MTARGASGIAAARVSYPGAPGRLAARAAAPETARPGKSSEPLRLALLSPLASLAARPLLGPAAAQADDWKNVVDGAKREGKVVMYSGGVGAPTTPKIAAAFEKRCGVRVEVLEARASELRERTRTEQASGKVPGGVSHNGSTTALQLAEGTFQPHGPSPNRPLYSGIASSVSMRLLSQTTMRSRKRRASASVTSASR